MSSTTCNVLRIYGDAAHRDRVGKVMSAVFNVTPWAPEPTVNKAGTLLAVVEFVWLGESLVEFVADLSRRMPSVTFDFCTEVHSPERVGKQRRLLVAGQVVKDPESVYQSHDDELLLRTPERIKLVLLNDGSVDYFRFVIASIDQIYQMVYDEVVHSDIAFAHHWKEKMEMSSLAEELVVLESLLTPEEILHVVRYREQQDQKVYEFVARARASDSLRETAKRLADPNVARHLEEEDRRAIERLSLLATKL